MPKGSSSGRGVYAGARAMKKAPIMDKKVPNESKLTRKARSASPSKGSVGKYTMGRVGP
jgi:hypothetical protein